MSSSKKRKIGRKTTKKIGKATVKRKVGSVKRKKTRIGLEGLDGLRATKR